MAGRIAAPLELTTEQRQDTHCPEPGAFNTAEAGGAGADCFARGRWRERGRDGAAAGHMAQDGQHLAPTLARGGRRDEHGGTFERRATLRGAW